MSDWHGWGTETTSLSVMEHLTRKGKFVLMLASGNVSNMVAQFEDEQSAQDVQDWLDAAFGSARAMNSAVLERAVDHGLLSAEEAGG